MGFRAEGFWFSGSGCWVQGLDDDVKRGVVEAAIGQVVPSFQTLEAILERYQPGGVEGKAKPLTPSLRNLPTATSSTDCVGYPAGITLSSSASL